MAKILRGALIFLLAAEIVVSAWHFFAQKWAEEQRAKQALLAQQITAWEKVLTDQGETRNGLLNLALLHYQVYKDGQAKVYWQRAAYLDPEFVASLPRLPGP